MANLVFHGVGTSLTCYLTVENMDGEFRDFGGSDWEAINTGNWTNYDTGGGSTDAIGRFVAAFPALSAGRYRVTCWEQAGGSPAYTDTRVETREVDWDGTRFVSWVTATSELAAEPGSSASILNMLIFEYMRNRNKRTQTSSVETVFNDADVAIATRTKSDDGTTFTQTQYS